MRIYRFQSESRSSRLINGAHVVIRTKDSEADRAFFRDVLRFPSVDAGYGWLIFAMPPLEAAFHPSESNDHHELYLMCDDIAATLNDLKSKSVKVSDVTERGWGKLANFMLPGGGKIGVYEPKHPSPLRDKSRAKT
ncbi:MAG: extradiol dioxygenase [Candidatus Sulfotelmatobacter sp.]